MTGTSGQLSKERTSVGVIGGAPFSVSQNSCHCLASDRPGNPWKRAHAGGAWGTALAMHAAAMGHDTIIWVREKEVAESINDPAVKENTTYLQVGPLAHPNPLGHGGPESSA